MHRLIVLFFLNEKNMEPTTIIAGDTVEFDKSSAMEVDGETFDFPSSQYSLKYKIIGQRGVSETIVAATEGEGYSVTISTTITSALTAGTYTLVGWVEKTGYRKTIYSAPLEVKPNLATATTATDTREFWQKIVDALKATMQNRASIVQQSMTVPGITGKTIQYMTMKELQQALAHAEYKLAQATIASKQYGGRSRPRILTRFGSAI